MIPMQTCGFFCEQGHQRLGGGVAGVAAGDENGIDARQLAENVAPFARARIPRCRRRCNRASIAGYQIQTSRP